LRAIGLIAVGPWPVRRPLAKLVAPRLLRENLFNFKFLYDPSSISAESNQAESTSC